MVVNFSITGLSYDLSKMFYDDKHKKWYWKNANIPEEVSIQDLTDEHKESLARLALYEGMIEIEEMFNLPKGSFKIEK